MNELEARLAPAVIAPIRVKDDFYSTASYGELVVGGTGVLRNDSRGLQVSEYTSESVFGAAVIVLPTGGFQYNPLGSETLEGLAPGTKVRDSFTYTVTNKTGQTNTATVTVDFKAPALLPDWRDAAVMQDVVLQVNAAEGVLANDHQPPAAPPLAVQRYSRTSAWGATVKVNPDGSYTYDPTKASRLLALPAGQIITDTFDYWVSGQGKATVTLGVVGVRNGAEDLGATNADTPLVVAAPGLLANDVGTAPKVISSDKVSALGAKVEVLADGSFVYTPGSAIQLRELAQGEAVYDYFSYISGNGRARTKVTVSIAVTGVNDVPVANEDTAETASNRGMEITTSVLTNDVDVDADDGATPLQIIAFDTESVLGASVRVRPDGTYTYDPSTSSLLPQLARDEVNVDSFTYTVTDKHGATAVGTVRVTVKGIEHPISVAADSYTTSADQALAVDAITGVLANDGDGDVNDVVSVIEYDRVSAQGAIVEVASDGSFVYDPSHSEALAELAFGDRITDTFTYVASDGHGSVATVTVEVVVRGVSHGADDNFFATLTSVYTSEAPGLMYNDDLASPSVLSYDATSALGAAIVMNTDGSFTYDATNIDPGVLANAIAASDNPDVAYDHFSYISTDVNTGAQVMANVTVALDVNGTAPIDPPSGGEGRPTPPVTITVSSRVLNITTTTVPSGRSGVRIEITPLRNNGDFDVIYETWLTLWGQRLWMEYDVLGTYNFFNLDSALFNGSNGDDIFVIDYVTNLPITAYGNFGNDVLVGGAAVNTIYGGEGNDELYGQNNNDLLFGEGGNDRLSGWNGNDKLEGGAGHDALEGGFGDDILDGGSGADIYIGGPGATLAIKPNRSEEDLFNPTPGNRINPGENDLIIGLKPERQTDRDLSTQAGSLTASLNSDGSVLTINGPSLYGFEFRGSAGAFQVKPLSNGGEEFIATSAVSMTTAVGNLPIPASSTIPLIVRTTQDQFARAGVVSSISIKNLLSLKTSNPTDPLAQFKQDFGLNFAPSGLSLDFGLKLGKDLDGLGVGAPLNPSIPYFFFKSGAASMPTLSLGETSISGGVSGGIYVAFDPSDPFLYLKTVIPASPLSEIAFAGSIKGQIPFVARQTPSLFSPSGVVKFREATATFSQPGQNISATIDGVESGPTGWAVLGQATAPQTAVFQPIVPLNTDQITFDMVFNSPYRDHQLQKLRLSYTTDADPTATSGANWITLTPSSAKQKRGAGTVNGDGSISFANGGQNDTYQITVDGPFNNVTGIRLEAIPVSGKLGFYSTGNFVLSEFKATTIAEDPSATVPQLFGNVFGEAKLNIDKFQVSLEGSFVLDLDANNDGTPLGLSGNELSQLFKGKVSLDTVLGNVLSDVRMGANARINAEIGLGSTGLGLTVPLASATAIVKDNAIAMKGATSQPFEGTALSFIKSPSVAVEGYFTAKRDFGFSFNIETAKLGGFDLGGTAASLKIDNSGAKFSASYRMPILKVQAAITGNISATGLFELIASLGASFDAGPVTLRGSVAFRFANFDVPGVPLGGVTFSGNFGVEGTISIPVFPDPFVRARGQAKFTVAGSGLSISGSGRVEGGVGSLSIGVGFNFSNTGFTVVMPSFVPNLHVRF